MKRILIVNKRDKRDPEHVKYVNSKNVKDIGVWFLGRRFSNYIVLLIEDEKASIIELTSSNVHDIQNQIDDIMKGEK